MLRQYRKTLIIAGVAVLVIVVAAVTMRRSPAVQYFSAKVARGEIRDVVDATGTVTPVITVQVGSQVSGTIAKLFVDFNSRVHRGDTVALIDPQLLQGTLLQATADLENANANVVVAQANLDKAKAALVQAKADFDRTSALVKDKVETEQVLEQSQATYQSAQAAVSAANAGLVQAKAQVTQKQAAQEVAKTNLGYTVIRSPIDGVVVARNVDVGQTVAASLSAPTIFTIAKDLSHMQVYAKIDEGDVGRIKMQQPVSFKVDAFPKDTFVGSVSQIRMNATMVQNVVTYDCIIDFANPQLKLFPGMTAYVTIPVATAHDALSVPNAALRFHPPMASDAVDSTKDEGGTKRGGKETGTVWKWHADGRLEPVKIALGITDHAVTEVLGVLDGKLAEGDDVVTAALGAKSTTPATIRR